MNILDKEFLISEFWRFHEEFGRYPLGKDFKENKNYPSLTGYKRIWGTWNDFLIYVNVLGEDSWYKCDEDVLLKLYETGKKEEIIEKLIIKRSWDTIIKKANKMGLKRDRKISREHLTFSSDFLINELLRFKDTYDRVPKFNDFDKIYKDFPCPKVYQERFGSWNKALIAAGLELNNITKCSKQDIINDIVDFYNSNGRSPYNFELKYSSTIIRKFFGGWNNALKECDLPLSKKETIFKSKDEAIKFLQDLFNQLNKVPSSTDVEKAIGLHKGWFRDNFGSYKSALFEAGLITKDKMISKQQRTKNSINGLKKLYEKLNKCPTVEEYEECAREKYLYDRKSLEYHLNLNYNDICLKYLGEANLITRTKDEIYSILFEAKEKLGRTPMSQELHSLGLDVKSCSRVYGMTYNNMIESFGWEISGNKVNIKTDKEMLDDYLNLFNKINRLPLMNDINSYKDMCNYSTYCHRFGSLLNVWILLGIDYEEEINRGEYGYVCVDNNGELCKSYREMIITNILIHNNVKYEKEYDYKNLIEDFDKKMRFDWYLPDYDISIEFFGLFDKRNINKQGKLGKYARKTINKIKLCNENNIKLMSLYVGDLIKNYDGLLNKFKEFGIELKIDNNILIKVS